jgi:glycosyltransferase XagB
MRRRSSRRGRWVARVRPIPRAREPRGAPRSRTVVLDAGFSASRVVNSRQSAGLIGAATVVVGGLVVDAHDTLVAVIALGTAAYMAVMLHGLLLFRAMLRRPRPLSVNEEEARSIPDAELPRYTVLVAAYHEAEVIADTLRALEQLDYPRDRLEVVLLLELDDDETADAARRAQPGPEVRILRIPDLPPRTKPRALNVGLSITSGELVTVYDAEDRPEPLQLRRAVAAFRRSGPELGCLQAMLGYHNAGQNLLTRWFTAEYTTWFDAVLPALSTLHTPIPLGGTSMHLRRETLEQVGGWDPHNVTEDADLGIRLARLGYRTEILESHTLEEANSDVINWVKQRSRWYKGYLQTWLVHTRHPVRLARELGPAGVFGFAATVAATPLVALVNPLFWLLAWLWLFGEADTVRSLFPSGLYYAALLAMVVGNFLAVYRAMIALRLARRTDLLLSVLLYPLYWALMSAAAIRAVLQLMVAPFFWEKTAHGLDRVEEPQGA